MSINAATRADIKQLLTIAPAVHHFEFKSLKLPDCPWLIIIGDADEVVSPQAVIDYANALERPVKLITMENAGHLLKHPAPVF